MQTRNCIKIGKGNLSELVRREFLLIRSDQMNANVWLYLSGMDVLNGISIADCIVIVYVAGYVRRHKCINNMQHMLYGTWEKEYNGRLKGFILLTQQ